MLPILTKSTIDGLTSWREALSGDGAVVLIDKEAHWSSFDVVAKIRGVTRIRRVGHAGTLDHLATGLLIVALGRATKQIDSFQAQEKCYTATMKLGATTVTYDAEGEEENLKPIGQITRETIEEVIHGFVGEISQLPPMFSAIKKEGVPLYKFARKGKEIERSPRLVTIRKITLTDFAPPFCGLSIECAKGTYIRSLVHDIGQQLKCGAYVHELRRSGIGSFSVNEALNVSEFVALYKGEKD